MLDAYIPPRVVITGLNADGRACVTADGPIKDRLPMGEDNGFEFYRAWSSDESGAETPSGADGVAGMDIFPPAGGTRLQWLVYPNGFGTAAADDETAPPLDRLLMHRADAIDYGIILEGEMTLVLEDGSETQVRAGDLVVQNGTVHGWRNDSGAGCVAVFVVVGTPATGG